MEPLYVKGDYVYVGIDTPARKGVSLVNGTTYEVMPIELDSEWYGFLYAPDGYATRVPMQQFKSLSEIRKEIIDAILTDL